MSALAPWGDGARAALDEPCAVALERALHWCRGARAAQRIWEADHTLWSPSPAEIANRLGWLRAPEAMLPAVETIRAFVEAVCTEGFSDVLLLGMGGSSLAPEMFASAFPAVPGRLRVTVLDSTDPGAVLSAEQRLDPRTTLYLVSTKSGGTVETLSLFKYFHGLACERLGEEAAGRHFAAITDPGSTLEATARSLGARAVFLNDPEVGGRFSALTWFGLVPAALVGVDLARLLAGARGMAARCAAGRGGRENPGLLLGALVGALALVGRNKLTLLCSPAVAAFGAWAEQLVAESTGKHGRGIVPIDGEAASAGVCGPDRLFVGVQLAPDAALEATLAARAAQGHPVVALPLSDAYDLGAELFRWEFATAVAGALLGVNPFDQPDVESAKVQSRRALEAYRERGALPAAGDEVSAADAAGEIGRALDGALPGDYVALQAFADPGRFGAGLAELADAIRRRSGLAVTAGWGPRFLHSTGQLHKGGPATGVFVQLVASDPRDAAIPDAFGSRRGAVGFGVLKAAQALGDLAALRAAGRRVLRVNLGGGAPAALAAIARELLERQGKGTSA